MLSSRAGLVPVVAHAQDLAASFDQLRFVIKPGSELRVLESTGREVSGIFGGFNGFIAGGLGLLIGLALDNEVGSGAVLIPISMALYGGIGAGIGVGVDALIRGRRTVCDAGIKRSSLSVAPVVAKSHTHKGVAVTLAF